MNNKTTSKAWFLPNYIPTHIFGFLSYILFLGFNLFNFFFWSPTKYTGNSFWFYTIVGFLISSFILWIILKVKKGVYIQTYKQATIVSANQNQEIQDLQINDYAQINPTEIEEIQITPTVKSNFTNKDDLKIIEGIGPKIEELLNKSGITTFTSLATAKVEELVKILENGGSKFKMHNPQSWSEQSALARDGKWSELTKLQDLLIGGGIK
jgi:predicted flap endonuclease-1-like 5' DNA nuclease